MDKKYPLKGSVHVAGKIKNYFACGNTARGFFSLYDGVLEDLNKVFILQGGPGTGKTTLMKKVGEIWAEKGYAIDYIHSPIDNESIDGIKILGLQVGIVNGTAPNHIVPKALGAIEEYINLGEACDAEKLSIEKGRLVQFNKEIQQYLNQAYSVFAEALRVHDDWEKIYIENMDFEKADGLTKKLISLFFGNASLNKKADVKHRFLGAATPIGAVDYVPNLTEDVPKRYFIKGRPGSGKSTMLKKIAAEGQNRGFDVEIYHCGFDPHSLDMIIFRELGITIFDSTAPHEYFPSREGDEIIDVYGSIISIGTDEIFADKIEVLSKQYKDNMKKAISHLAEAKSLRDEVKSIYTDAIDFNTLNTLTEKVQKEIEKLES